MDIDLAVHEIGGDGHGATFARGGAARCELRIVVDVFDDHGAHRVIKYERRDQDPDGPDDNPSGP
jgi:hypothetical protein